MINDTMESKWRLNTKKYLVGLQLIGEYYKDKRISFKQKKELEKNLDKEFEKNYWKLNPNLENPLLREMFLQMLNTYEVKGSY